MWHPTLIAEALFAIANIFSSLRLISLFTANSHLGPLQISLGRMLLDILKFLFIYCLVRHHQDSAHGTWSSLGCLFNGFRIIIANFPISIHMSQLSLSHPLNWANRLPFQPSLLWDHCMLFILKQKKCGLLMMPMQMSRLPFLQQLCILKPWFFN